MFIFAEGRQAWVRAAIRGEKFGPGWPYRVSNVASPGAILEDFRRYHRHDKDFNPVQPHSFTPQTRSEGDGNIEE